MSGSPVEAVTEEPWQRLDPRMLLVHPVRELVRFLPVLIGIAVAGSGVGNLWQLVGLAIPVGIGLLRYLTTRFRISGGRVELRRGLLNTHVTTAQLDRVRTVEVTASPIHRLLGLTTVRIGTGTSTTQGQNDGLDLDGLPTERARALRRELLHSVAPATTGGAEAAEVAGAADDARTVARFAPDWLRYAPFTTSGLVIAAAILGFGGQVADTVGLWDRLDVTSAGRDTAGTSPWVVMPVIVLVALVGVVVLSVVGYLLANGNFTLTHTRSDGSWHLRRGLLTTRETSLDAARVRGVAIGEPLGLRLARGARLSAIVTGLDRQQQGSSTLVPPAPRDVVDAVAADVLGDPAPVTVALTAHGPRAVRRRWTRALVPAVLAATALATLPLTGAPWWWLAAVAVLAGAVVLAIDRSRGLGHALAGGYLVARSGSLTRHRQMLGTDAIIGWNVRSTWFQRRAGLVTLVATTAGGSQHVEVPDVPVEVAVAVASRGVPGLVDPFCQQ